MNLPKLVVGLSLLRSQLSSTLTRRLTFHLIATDVEYSSWMAYNWTGESLVCIFRQWIMIDYKSLWSQDFHKKKTLKGKVSFFLCKWDTLMVQLSFTCAVRGLSLLVTCSFKRFCHASLMPLWRTICIGQYDYIKPLNKRKAISFPNNINKKLF